MRVPQITGERGSLKWIQRSVAAPAAIDRLLLQSLSGATGITWLSPRADDDFAEYRDRSFLDKIGCPELADELAAFWPSRGPQWDALARSDAGQVLLVEAKAHIAEMCSPGTMALGNSRDRIKSALEMVSDGLGAEPLAPWSTAFYQLANRIAHLWFLRKNGVDAKLLLIGFLGDDDMQGPSVSETWDAAYRVAFHVMGLAKQHPLAQHIIHIHPDVSALRDCGQIA